MPPDDERIERLERSLLDSMLEYASSGHGGYSEAHVGRCGAVLDRYLKSISVARDESAALECVRVAVLELNELNAETDHSLIETGEREALWEIISEAGARRGFFLGAEDVTEQWRDW